MVGFNTAIKTSYQASSKLSDQTGPLTDLIEFQDPSLPLLDPLPDFDFVDDWIVDNDSIDMSVEESLEPIILALKQEAVIQDISLGCLIEEEMGKVSLAGVSESSNVVDVKQESHENMPELKPEENAVPASDVPISYEVLDGLKLIGDDKEENVENSESLVTDKVNLEDIAVEAKVESRVIVNNEKDSSSSSSSGSESEVESDSSSSSSSSEEEEEEKSKKMDDDIDVEEGEIKDFDPDEILIGSDEDEPAIKGPIKSKNEVEFLPPVSPVDVSLQPYHQTLPVGVVLSIMDAKVVIEGREKHNPLNEGSILWITETRSPLGRIDEIFGPVKNPFYIVRYNSEQEIPSGVSEGIAVSFVADFADHVLNDKNLYKKGYDASGENDEEIDEEIEFSDDEKEAEYRRAQKMASKGGNDRKRGNRDSDARKKVQHKGSWKNTNTNSQPPAQNFAGPTGQPGNPNQFHPPSASSSSAGPQSIPTPVTPAPHMMPGWTNGMPGQMQQQQQHMVFPNGFPMNGVPLQQLNPYQMPHQMPPQMFNNFQGGMLPPFQPQFNNHNQGMMQNMQPLQYGQPNFPQGGMLPWQGHPGQGGFNQVQFGMGLPGQNVGPFVNQGEPQGGPNGLNNGQSNETAPGSNMQGNFSSQHQQSPGRTNRGRGGSFRRGGGGRFSGRRGGRQ